MTTGNNHSPDPLAEVQQRWPGWRVWKTSGSSPGFCATWKLPLTEQQIAAGWARVVCADDLATLEARLSQESNTTNADSGGS